MTSKHRGLGQSNPAPAPYASKKNESPESNIASNDDSPPSLALLDPNPGGLLFYDDIWMIDIPGVDQGLDILQYLTLTKSISADNLSIEVSLYDDTERVHKYKFPDR